MKREIFACVLYTNKKKGPKPLLYANEVIIPLLPSFQNDLCKSSKLIAQSEATSEHLWCVLATHRCASGARTGSK